VNPTPNLKTC